MYRFNSQIKFEVGPYLEEFSVDDIKNEPMLFNCDLRHAVKLGGLITDNFLDIIPRDWFNAKDLIIDSRVHMLMPGWYPCIPGFHHDDVPREREDGQPNYINPSYRSEHIMAVIGDCSLTEFAIGESEFPEVPLGEKYYKVWHPMVVDKIKTKELGSLKVPERRLCYFDWQSWHQGTAATKDGWRWFVRASRNTKRIPTNELRRQVQVYLESPMEGW